MEQDTSRLKRPVLPVPDEVERALNERGLAQAYRARPAYQRNDYIAWITGKAGVNAPKAPEADARGAGRRRPLHEHALAPTLAPSAGRSVLWNSSSYHAQFRSW
jgi:hypothetical protein